MEMWPFSRKSSSDAGAGPRAPIPAPGAPTRDPASPAGLPPGALLGQDGEKLALRLLRGLRYKVLAANFRCPAGEIDLIALDRSTVKTCGMETIVFVEIKTRTSDRFTAPQSAVDSAKQKHIRQAAAYYLARRDAAGFAIRYDIIAIVASPGKEPRIEHIKDAFE